MRRRGYGGLPGQAIGRSGLVLLSALVALTALAPGAAAQRVSTDDKQKVLLVPMERADNVSSVIPARVFEYLRTIIEMNESLLVLGPGELVEPSVEERERAKETDPTLVKADASLWEAKELAEKKDYMGAIKAFKKAVSLYQKGMDQLVDFDKYVDAALGVALAYFMAGYDDNGEDALTPVLVVRPSLVLDKRKVPAAAASALERLKLLYAKAETGVVEVTSEPEGAAIYLDGVLVGHAPARLEGMLRGTHWVRVVAQGHKPWSKSFQATGRDRKMSARLPVDRIAARDSSRNELDMSPDGLVEAVRTGNLGEDFLKAADFVCQKYEIDAIVMTYVRRTPSDLEMASFLYDQTQKRVAELEWIHMDHDLASMQVNLLVLEEKLLQALAVFPRSRILAGRSQIYEVIEPPKPEPVVVVTPAPEPEPVVEAKPEPEPVAKPEPEPEPDPVAEARPAPRPALRPAPRPAAERKPAPVAVIAPSRRLLDGPGAHELGNYDVYPAPERAKAPLLSLTPVPAADTDPWYEAWWLWTIVGVVVAGGAATAVVCTVPGLGVVPAESGGSGGFSATVSWTR